jgi:hypothetical protein
MTRFITNTIVNLVTPKAVVKNELFFNKLATEVGLLNKSSFLGAAFGCDQIYGNYW